MSFECEFSNKGMAFSLYERQLLGIHGLLPPAVLTQDVQAMRIMANFQRETNDLDRYIDLVNLQDRFQTPFIKPLNFFILSISTEMKNFFTEF